MHTKTKVSPTGGDLEGAYGNSDPCYLYHHTYSAHHLGAVECIPYVSDHIDHGGLIIRNAVAAYCTVSK